jgi:hypothetical protein
MTLDPDYFAPIDAAIRVTPDARAAFEREWRPTCPCGPNLDVLEGAHGRLRCARCSCPILRRHRTEARP